MRRKLLSIVVAVLALSSRACGTAAPVASSHPRLSGAYVAEIKRILAGHPSAFEKRVFADYYVTAAENEQAEQLYVKCMKDKGWDATPQGGQFSITGARGNPDPDNSEAMNKADLACEAGTTENVSSIYFRAQSNPLDLAFAQQVRACYKKYKVPDGGGSSDKAFTKLVADTGYVPSSPVAKMCFMDPDGSQGLTPQDAARLWKPSVEHKVTMTCDKDGKDCTATDTAETPSGKK